MAKPLEQQRAEQGSIREITAGGATPYLGPGPEAPLPGRAVAGPHPVLGQLGPMIQSAREGLITAPPGSEAQKQAQMALQALQQAENRIAAGSLPAGQQPAQQPGQAAQAPQQPLAAARDADRQARGLPVSPVGGAAQAPAQAPPGAAGAVAPLPGADIFGRLDPNREWARGLDAEIDEWAKNFQAGGVGGAPAAEPKSHFQQMQELARRKGEAALAGTQAKTAGLRGVEERATEAAGYEKETRLPAPAVLAAKEKELRNKQEMSRMEVETASQNLAANPANIKLEQELGRAQINKENSITEVNSATSDKIRKEIAMAGGVITPAVEAKALALGKSFQWGEGGPVWHESFYGFRNRIDARIAGAEKMLNSAPPGSSLRAAIAQQLLTDSTSWATWVSRVPGMSEWRTKFLSLSPEPMNKIRAKQAAMVAKLRTEVAKSPAAE